MNKILDDVYSDEDCRALQSLPPGWLAVPAAGWWFASRACEVTGVEFSPLGPYPDASAAVDAARRAELEARG